MLKSEEATTALAALTECKIPSNEFYVIILIENITK